MASEARREAGDIAAGEEITIERRVRPRDADRPSFSSRLTIKMVRVDAQLLAIARGEREPGDVDALLALDDPSDDGFGGLIPVYGDDDAEEILDDWLIEDTDQELLAATRPPPIPYGAVPRVCMKSAELVKLVIDHRSGFLLSHIDGQRSVDELIDISHLNREDAVGVLATLIALGAIALD